MSKRQVLFFFGALVMPFILISWGVTGHRTIGKIAERHLSTNASAAVKALLGSERLADVASWADEVRNDPAYKSTGPWHFLNLPLGLSYAAFEKQVKEMSEENVYSALLKEEQVLGDQGAPLEKRVEALKFVVHFVGDIHQPMHISRAEDKGGNTIQLNYEGQGTNLHSLWDTRLLEHQGLTYDQLTEKYDKVSPEQVRKWQRDPLIKWIWESYAISSKLYAEVDAMKSRRIDDNYYQQHIGLIRERIEMAGVRLAGVLNEIFKNGAIGIDASAAGRNATDGFAKGMDDAQAKAIDVHAAGSHMNEYVRICATVYGYKELSGLTLVSMGAAYPYQLLTVVLKGKSMNAAAGIDGKNICVTGKIIEYKGKPEIIVTDPGQLTPGK